MNHILIFITTFIIQFIIASEMNMLSPLAPFLSDYFNIKDNYVILFNLGYSAVGIFVPYLGILSDKYGKRKMLSFALMLFILGSIIASLAKSPLLFAFGRIFIGLGYFSLSGTNLSYVSEFINYENRGMASGILRIAFGLATLFTPIYSSNLISKFNSITSVYVPIIILGIIAFILLLKLPETNINSDKEFELKEFMNMLSDSKNKKVFASLFFISTAPTMLLNFLGIYLSNQYNIPQVRIGMSYTVLAIGTITGIFVAAIFTDKVGKLRLSKILFLIMVLAQIFIPYINNVIIIIILSTLFVFGLDGGWTAYQTFASEISPEKRGTFMSLFYTVNALTVTFYSITGSVIYSIGGFKLAVSIGTLFSGIGLFLVNSLSKNND